MNMSNDGCAVVVVVVVAMVVATAMSYHCTHAHGRKAKWSSEFIAK